VREVARKDKGARLTVLLHHVSFQRLVLAFDGLERGAAPGVDGVTWREYDRNRQGNLLALHGRVQSGKYRAVPSRRVYIPKADGRLRPLGIASLEDKVVQRAVTGVLNAVCEADVRGALSIGRYHWGGSAERLICTRSVCWRTRLADVRAPGF